MKSITNPLPSDFFCFFGHYPHRSHLPRFPHCSFSTKRRRSRHSRRFRITTNRPSDFKRSFLTSDSTNLNNIDINNNNNNQSLELVLDVSQITYRFNQFVSLSKDAYYDLKTLISIDDNNRIVFSCRKSTFQFTGAVLVGGFVFFSVIRILVKLGLGFRNWIFKIKNNYNSNKNVVVRRDRSLGGKEVVVATRVDENGGKDVKRKRFGILDDLVEKPGRVFGSGLERDDWRNYRVRSASKLPKWWPVSVGVEGDDLVVVDKHEYQRDANRLIRAITDYRTSGKDVTEHDIIQLRRICRTSGVQVSFDTTNTRDTFYRAAVDYVLNVCSRNSGYTSAIQIDGEDARKFVAGLAGNIGLEDTRAARMVCAAVAARTRSCFLQAWALEVQSKHHEAAQELSKICVVLGTFPSEESSPEMEMVARGLGKNLKLEQRELLMNMFVSVCSEDSHRIAAEALGLMISPSIVNDGQESKLSEH